MGMSSWRSYFSRPQPRLSSSSALLLSILATSSGRPASAHIPLIGQGRARPRSGQNTPEEGLIPSPKTHSFTKHPSQAKRGSANCPRPRRCLSRRVDILITWKCLTRRAPGSPGPGGEGPLTCMLSALASSFSCMACTEGRENTLLTHVFTSSDRSRTPRAGWVWLVKRQKAKP